MVKPSTSSTSTVDERVPKDGEEPGANVGTLFVLVPGAERLEHGLLREIVGLAGIGAEPQRDTIHSVEMRYRLLFKCTPLVGVRSRHDRCVSESPVRLTTQLSLKTACRIAGEYPMRNGPWIVLNVRRYFPAVPFEVLSMGV
jgi:hypothetical protein